MRIISGKFKGRTLIAPPEGTRPTADRAKEMLFDILTSRFIKEGKRWEQLTFADVFSGSGAVGLEAVSRGCKHVYLFEHETKAQKTIRQNGHQMTFDLFGDALTPPFIKAPIDILFMDPPYGTGLWEQALEAFLKQGWITQTTLVVVEEDKSNTISTPKGFKLTEKRASGRNTFYFLTKED